MTLGLRSILLLVAIVLFLIGGFSPENARLLWFGLAAFAASFLVGDLPAGRGGMGGRRGGV